MEFLGVTFNNHFDYCR